MGWGVAALDLGGIDMLHIEHPETEIFSTSERLSLMGKEDHILGSRTVSGETTAVQLFLKRI